MSEQYDWLNDAGVTVPVVLAVVGSTQLQGDREARQIITDVFDEFLPVRFVSGGAPGIDSMAETEARRRGIPCSIHKPKVRSWREGFMPRNLLIAKDCTHLVRIIAKSSRTYGSGWTRDRAKEMGKYTREYVIDV